MNWNTLLHRHGWLLKNVKGSVFDCSNETKENMEFLLECLEKAEVEFELQREMLTLPTVCILEEHWLAVVDFEHRGRVGNTCTDPGETPRLRELDTYISGLVRQLNRLGFNTTLSCDGHDRRAPHVMTTKDAEMESLSELLIALGFKRVYFREQRNSYHVSFPLKKMDLLDLAESLTKIDKAWISRGFNFIREQLFLNTLECLLNVQGASGKEARIRQVVQKKLAPFVDYLTVDAAGNLLAEKKYRGGNGPTILLNAHLDTVDDFVYGRKVIKDGSIWTSDKGILGADDRAGVAVLLHLAEHLALFSTFSGKVKFIFTVEEETGLNGARSVADYFLWNTDAAIVVDRRGEGDVVTSCGGYIPFCHPKYGAFFETTALENGLAGWKVTEGGSSDTRIWAEHGIESVNLSAGYHNEHQETETIDVNACYETVKLIQAVFARGREMRSVLQDIRRKENTRILSRTAGKKISGDDFHSFSIR